jgi:antitoxin component of MazEF toxin-antitoxin module
MIKTLTKHGNSLALVIDRPVLDLLNIDADTPIQIATDGHVLILSPVRSPRRRRKFRDALASTNQRYGRMLQRLAE